jgi:hypothetical protein
MLTCLVGWSGVVSKQDCMTDPLARSSLPISRSTCNLVVVAPSVHRSSPFLLGGSWSPTLFRSLWSLLSLKHGENKYYTHKAWGGGVGVSWQFRSPTLPVSVLLPIFFFCEVVTNLIYHPFLWFGSGFIWFFLFIRMSHEPCQFLFDFSGEMEIGTVLLCFWNEYYYYA